MASDRMKLLDECVRREGYRHGARIAEFIAEWELAVRAHRREVTAEEFAAWWKDSRRTAYRRIAEFRAAFPELGAQGLPQDLMRPLLKRLAAEGDPAPLPPPGWTYRRLAT